MREKDKPSLIEVNGSNPVQRKRESAVGLSLYESTVTLSQIPDVVARLDAKGLEGSFAVFTLETQGVVAGFNSETQAIEKWYGSDRIIFPYKVVNGFVGLEWPMRRLGNAYDIERFVEYISQQGYKFTSNKNHEEPHIRVEEGDISGLGIRIAKELYQIEPNAEVSLLVDGFEKPELMMVDVKSFVRQKGSQQGFAADVERISEALRTIPEKYWTDYDGEGSRAYAFLNTPSVFVFFSILVDEKFTYIFESHFPAEPRTQKLEEELLGVRGINLLVACGYHRAYSDGNDYENCFSVVTDDDFREFAELYVGLLHMLYDHQPGCSLDIDFMISEPELPEALQAPYHEFMARYHNVMIRFHELMATESLTLPEHQLDELIETSTEMEKVIDKFPWWIQEMEDLGSFYDTLHSSATETLALLIVCLNNLRQRFNTHPPH